MQEESYLGHQIERTSIEVRYDEAVKRLLANKLILATIMQGCVEEYRNCTVQEIAEQYIEDEPQIGTVGVNPDDTNAARDKNIHGSNTEDATLTEGTVRYDIRFYATAPAGNGRLARNTLEKAIFNQSRRLVAEPAAALDLILPSDLEFEE